MDDYTMYKQLNYANANTTTTKTRISEEILFQPVISAKWRGNRNHKCIRSFNATHTTNNTAR